MNLLVNIAARFLPKREFHANPKVGASAPVAAGYSRQGDGSQILGGVLVAVVLGTTILADPPVYTEGQAVPHDAADVASLGRGEPAVGLNHDASGQWCFVVELPQELGHCGVMNRLGKLRPSHTLDAQILDADPAEPTHDARREVVCQVLSEVCRGA